MFRKPVYNPSLEALNDERDRLKVELSLALDQIPLEQERIAKLRQAVSEAESRIRLHFPRP